MFLFYLVEEQEFLLGQRAQPMGESLLEKGDVTVGEAAEEYKAPCSLLNLSFLPARECLASDSIKCDLCLLQRL